MKDNAKEKLIICEFDTQPLMNMTQVHFTANDCTKYESDPCHIVSVEWQCREVDR